MAKKKKTSKAKPLGSVPNVGTGRRPAQRQVDKLDREILQLLNRRAEMALQRSTGNGVKNGASVLTDTPVLEAILKQNKGPLSENSIRAIFREVLSSSRAIVALKRVAFLGPEFTYSHLAAIEFFGQSTDLVAVGTIGTVFEEVERGDCDYGIVPIENSTDGRVADSLTNLAQSSVRISGEVPLRIHHCLLATCARGKVEHVFSKPQALSQCRNWLGQHLPQANLVEVTSTAEAARTAAQTTHTAAIASAQAGVNHGLDILARNIEDNLDNVTRFAVIGAESGPRTGNDKTSLVFEIHHHPGALADAMGVFKRHRLNMTWIESFPLPGQRGRYVFFVEFEGHSTQLRPRRALESLGKKAVRLTVLGSYAQAEPIG